MKVGHKVWHEIGMHDEYLFWMAKHVTLARTWQGWDVINLAYMQMGENQTYVMWLELGTYFSWACKVELGHMLSNM